MTWAKLLFATVLVSQLNGCAFFESMLSESQREQARNEYRRGDIDEATYQENMRRADESDRRNTEGNAPKVITIETD